jgi:hypothetical protein
MSSAGRPLTPIDWDVVGEWLMKGCSGVQIAAILGVHHETLYDRCVAEHGVYFSQFSLKYKSKGDSLLHAAQFDAALKGNTSMLIWLGKQRLDQSEKTTLAIKKTELQEILDENPSGSKELVNERKDTQPILASQPPLQDC